MKNVSRIEKLVFWFTTFALSEIIPIGVLTFGWWISSDARPLREVLGYSTILLVAFSLTVVVIGDALSTDITPGRDFTKWQKGMTFFVAMTITLLVGFSECIDVLGKDVFRARSDALQASFGSLASWYTFEIWMSFGILCFCTLVKVQLIEREQ